MLSPDNQGFGLNPGELRPEIAQHEITCGSEKQQRTGAPGILEQDRNEGWREMGRFENEVREGQWEAPAREKSRGIYQDEFFDEMR